MCCGCSCRGAVERGYTLLLFVQLHGVVSGVWRRCEGSERVDAISGEDRLLTKRIFELREAAQQASLAGGGVEMFQLSQELEVLINRQRALVQERDDHERHIK